MWQVHLPILYCSVYILPYLLFYQTRNDSKTSLCSSNTILSFYHLQLPIFKYNSRLSLCSSNIIFEYFSKNLRQFSQFLENSRNYAAFARRCCLLSGISAVKGPASDVLLRSSSSGLEVRTLSTQLYK